MKRLETISARLFGELSRASPEKQRKASLAACEYAISYAKVENPLVEETLARLRTSAALSPQQRAALKALASQLDEQYLDLQEAAEAGRATTAEYLQVFEKSLAVAALSCAANEDTFEASTEAVYEAAIATDKNNGLFAVVEAALK